MVRVSLHVIVFLMIGSLPLAWGTEGSGPARKRITADRGVIDPKGILRHRFELLNDTRSELRVAGTSVSCGCLKIVRAPRVIAAGERVPVDVELSPEDRQGRLTQIAYLEIAGKAPFVYELELSCIVPGVWFEPDSIHLGLLSGEGEVTREIRLYAAGVKRVAITKIETDDPRLGVTVVAADPSAKDKELTQYDDDRLSRVLRLTWDEDAGGGSESDSEADDSELVNVVVSVQTDLANSPAATLGVHGTLGSPLRAIPGGVFFGTVRGVGTFVRNCRIPGGPEDRLGQPTTRISTNHPGQVSASLKRGEGGADVLEVTLSTGTDPKPGAVIGTIRATTKSGRVLLAVPYAAYLMREADLARSSR